MMRCSSLKQSALRPSLGYYIVKERKKIELMRENEKKEGEKKKRKGIELERRERGRRKCRIIFLFLPYFYVSVVALEEKSGKHGMKDRGRD